MKNSIIIFLILFFFSLISKAQDATLPHAQPDSVIKREYITNGRYKSFLYIIGGKVQTSDEVKIKLLAYAPSAEECKIVSSDLAWRDVLAGGFLVTSVIGLIEFSENKSTEMTTTSLNGEPGLTYVHHSLTGAYVFTGIASAFFVASIVTLLKAEKHMNKALKLYNQRFE